MYTPPGNQPAYGNQPQFNQPTGNFVPPGQKRPGAGGCWLWGGVGCLVLFIVFGAIVGVGLYKTIHSLAGKGLIGSMSSISSSATKIAGNATKGALVASALAKYKADHGAYPDSLTDLVPKYLPDNSSLHLDSDPNTDPSHVSFDYKKPAATAPANTVLFSYHNPMNISMMGMSQKMDEKITYEVGGNRTMDMTQTVTTPDGRTVTSTSHMDMSTGKTTTTTNGMPVTSPSPFVP